MEYLDSEMIILEVKKFPCLYDKSHWKFKSREMKADAWTMVTKNVLGETWNNVDEKTRSNMRVEVQKRWRSMKDCYLKRMKNEKHIDGEKRKKPYVYHKHMAFLRAVYSRRETLEDIDEDPENTDTDEPTLPEIRIKEETIFDPLSFSPIAKKPKSARNFDRTLREIDEDRGNTNPEEPILLKIKIEEPSVLDPLSLSPIAKKSMSDHCVAEVFNTPNASLEQPPRVIQDPDEMFLLSQLSYIKTMSPSDKFKFQIKFLELIQTYSNPNT